MKIEFIKDHPAGIKKGLITIARTKQWGEKMIEEGFAKEYNEKPKETKKEKSKIDNKSESK